MVYMGSKRRYCKDIVPIINKYIKENEINVFWDAFCGGTNLADKIECENVVASDLSPSLIALHQQAQEDFSKIPTDGNREMWDNSYTAWKKMKQILDTKPFLNFTNEDFDKIGMPLYEIGCMEWYSSFSNGGFPRGYAKNSATRNYYQEAWRNHKKQSETEKYKKIVFCWGDYLRTIAIENALIYLDPPYKNTKQYGINPKFNHEEFYDWCRKTSKTNPIFISEQTMPDDFEIIWGKEATRTSGLDNNFKACEKLYFMDNRDNE